MAHQRTLKPINARRGHPATAYALPDGEYWVKTTDGTLGLRIRVSDGPAGLGVTVSRFVGTEPLTIADQDPGYIGVVQYRADDRSQAFARWYQDQATPADIAILGKSYRRGYA